MKDRNSESYFRKAMVMKGMSLGYDGLWSKGQVTHDLLGIIANIVITLRVPLWFEGYCSRYGSQLRHSIPLGSTDTYHEAVFDLVNGISLQPMSFMPNHY